MAAHEQGPASTGRRPDRQLRRRAPRPRTRSAGNLPPDRLALVPAPRRDWPAVLAALVDGIDMVLVATPPGAAEGTLRSSMNRRSNAAVPGARHRLARMQPGHPSVPGVRLVGGLYHQGHSTRPPLLRSIERRGIPRRVPAPKPWMNVLLSPARGAARASAGLSGAPGSHVRALCSTGYAITAHDEGVGQTCSAAGSHRCVRRCSAAKASTCRAGLMNGRVAARSTRPELS